MEQKEVINNFFQQNYNILLQKCQDYVRVYNYRHLEPDEIVSELYLFTLTDNKRTNKLSELIMLSAITLNKMYKYSTLAHYYISRILYNVIHGHRTFDNKYSEAKQLQIVYCQEIINEIQQEDYEESNIYTVENIYDTAQKIGTGDLWWKYVLWQAKFIEGKTYKQIGETYKLSTSPVFNGIKDFTILIRQELQKKYLQINQ